ncbi:MAG: leucyl aminopeptidase [Ilumatobacteraceae bacterium]|nr:leucyl aminopeptidase [Ilumatobacteraceae bacterium]
MSLTIEVVRSAPAASDAVGVPVGSTGAVPKSIGLTRAALAANGFEGSAGQTLVIPSATGPTVIAIGIGKPAELTANGLRSAAASFARAAGKRARLATTLADLDGVDAVVAGQAVVEGVTLANYRFVGLKNDKTGSPATSLALIAKSGRSAGVQTGADRGVATAGAATLARDLANTPPAYMTARILADKAVEIATSAGIGVEVFNKDQLKAMGCGGIVGVNAGSVEPPRMVRLTYTPPKSAGKATGHVVLVGKGVTYDSGGISLKPSDPSHASMKMDMSGAAAVLATLGALPALGCTTAVTGYLMCTDNMPSGSALKLGDVLTMRNGKTVEIHNTDAEGRLILADGLSLGAESKPDAMVDICTLTGAVIGALGDRMAGVLGNNQAWVDQVRASGAQVDEPTWQLPLAKEYRKLLDSHVADMRNIGGPMAGTITASLFLNEFTANVPWAHIDMAGTMKMDGDDGWLAKGATGYGTRLMIDLVTNFKPLS